MRHPRSAARAAAVGCALLLLVPGCAGSDPEAEPTPRPARVAFWGDSLTEGFPRPPFATDGSDSLAGRFQASNPDLQVYNGGVSGQSAAEIALRQGGLVVRLDVRGDTVPASGAVRVDPVETLGWRLDRDWADQGSLAGVPGTLTRSRSVLRFTRATPGAAVPVAGAEPFLSGSGTDHQGDVQVLFVGRNDIGYDSPSGDPVDRVVAAVRAMTSHLPPPGRFLVCGTTTATWDRAGTPGHAEVLAINERLAAEYPANYWNLRGWLVEEAMSELGIEPSPDDLAHVAADTLPPALMVKGDGVHYSPATAAALAQEIQEQLRSRGWIP